MSWNVEWTSGANRDLRRLDAQSIRRVLQGVDHYANSGHGDVRKLRGREDDRRLRIGDLRVIFRQDNSTRTIRILRVSPRDRAYRDDD